MGGREGRDSGASWECGGRRLAGSAAESRALRQGDDRLAAGVSAHRRAGDLRAEGIGGGEARRIRPCGWRAEDGAERLAVGSEAGAKGGGRGGGLVRGLQRHPDPGRAGVRIADHRDQDRAGGEEQNGRAAHRERRIGEERRQPWGGRRRGAGHGGGGTSGEGGRFQHRA